VEGLGAIHPYVDTEPNADSLLGYLEHRNVCAIWQLPGVGEDLIIVIYSRRSPGWQQFEMPPFPLTDSYLRVVLLNTRSSFSLEGSLTANANFDTPMPKELAPRPLLQLRTSPLEVGKAEGHGVQQHDNLKSAVSRADSPIFSPVEAPNTPSNGDYDMISAPSSPMSVEEKPSVSKSFSADFDALFSGIDRNQRKPRVFITFALSHPKETTIIKEWLRPPISGRYIFDNTEKTDWVDFQDSDDLSNKTTIILFHADRSSFTNLPGFFQVLRYPAVLCHSVRFANTADAMSSGGSNPFTMLFPRGTALCITKDLLTRLPEKALFTLRWFEKFSKGKAKTWKLVLFPDIQNLLKQLISTTDSEKTKL
jgi:hypothetical protein